MWLRHNVSLDNAAFVARSTEHATMGTLGHRREVPMSYIARTALKRNDERLYVSHTILAALAADGALRGAFVLDQIDQAEGFAGGDYYIEDLPIDLACDRRQIRSRLRTAMLHGRPVCMGPAASFTDYGEFAKRFTHYFQIDYYHLLLKVESKVNNLDWENRAPTPIFGHLHFYGDAHASQRDFDRIRQSECKQAERFAVQHVVRALAQLDGAARDAAARKLLARLGRVLG